MATPLPNGVRVPTTLPRLEKERLDTLARRVKGEIGVLYSEKQLDHSKMAASIASYLRTLNGDIKTHLLRYDHQNWVERAKEAGVLLFVFLGMPPLRAKRRIIVRRSSGLGTSSTPEEEYMSKVNRKVSDVVVLLPNMPSAKSEQQERQLRYGVHYLILVTHSEYNSLQSKMVFLSTFATKFAVRSLGLNSCNFWLSVLRCN